MASESSMESSVLTRLTSDIITNLNCPVCLQLADPPLMSCPNGHFTCSYCISKLTGDTLKKKSCPQCRETGFIRNLPYEKMARELLTETELKCPHSEDKSDGCTMTYKYGKLVDHLKVCKGVIQKYNCPCPRCTEHNLYSLPELIEHIIINLGFNTDEEYRISFMPSLAVGTLDSLIGGISVKVENSEFGHNLGIRLRATESTCSYSSSPIINYELHSDAYVGFNSLVIYPPYNFFDNFKKEDNLLTNTEDASDKYESVLNLTFLIDTSQIYLIRTTCSYNSNMIYCDGTYLNTLYMNEDDPHRVLGIVVNYNYNRKYGKEDSISSTLCTDSGEPETKRARRRTFNKIKYFDSKYFDITKYCPEMSEEVLNGTNLEIGINTAQHEALGHLMWYLIF